MTPTNPRRDLMTLWLDNEAASMVRDFWENAGEEEPFPRSLEEPLKMALPLALVRLPNLNTHAAENWLKARNRAFSFNMPTRSLHGCMVAGGGRGFIFVDGDDSREEQRFTIAHEIGHYLCDAVSPRLRAVSRMGESVLEVMDGLRPATMTERIAAAMLGVDMGPTFDLMARKPGGNALELWSAESRADRVAVALLAPPDYVLSLARGGPAAARQEAAAFLLRDKCGLPAAMATRYAAELLQAADKGPAWSGWLRSANRPT